MAANARRPLSARNADVCVPTQKTKKLVQVLDRQVLLDNLKQIVKESPADLRVPLSDDDLLKPTAEKIQHLYLLILRAFFNATPDSFKQASFQSLSVEHPELMEDGTWNLQFFFLIRFVMGACLVHDFQYSDIFDPTSKRTIRNFSAVLNFMKFHWTLYSDAGAEMDQLKSEAYDEKEVCRKRLQEGEEMLEALRLQKAEEEQKEEKLKLAISTKDKNIQATLMEKESLQNQSELSNDVKAQKQKRMEELKQSLERINLRNADLQDQRVSSPAKLHERLPQISQEVEDVKASTEDSEAQLRNWESLASKAQQLLPAVENLIHDINNPSTKHEEKRKLQLHVETIEDNVCQAKQVLKEASAKYQNLCRHLKWIEEESAQLVFESRRVPVFNHDEDLQGSVTLLKQEVSDKLSGDEALRVQVEETKHLLQKRKEVYEEECRKLIDLVNTLETLYKARRQKLEQLNEELAQKAEELF